MISPRPALTIEPVDPRNLREKDFFEINEVSREMWSDPKSLGELVECNSCQKMFSKADIFGHVIGTLATETVGKIMRTLGVEEKDILCPCCGSATTMIYGQAHVEKIKRRLLKSVDAFLVLCKNTDGEIVGYEEGYVDSLDAIFDGEFHYHYREIGVKEIQKRVMKVLGYNPKELLVLSSIGFMPRYQSASSLFRLLSTFARALPVARMDDLPGITEIDKKSSMHKISAKCGAISLGIADDPLLSKKITNTGAHYESDLIVYRDPIRQYKTQFDAGGREFLRKAA